MYILETEQSFDSAHFLSGYEGKCSNLHGHRWRVVARIAMDELNKEGQTRDMVIDFGDFKNALKKLTDALDHSFYRRSVRTDYSNDLTGIDHISEADIYQFCQN